MPSFATVFDTVEWFISIDVFYFHSDSFPLTVVEGVDVWGQKNCKNTRLVQVSGCKILKFTDAYSGAMPTPQYVDFREKTIFVLGILSFGIIPFILVGNAFVIISLIKFKFRFRNVTNLFIGSLSVADCLVAVLSLPLYVAFYFQGEELVTIKYLCLCKYSSVVCSMSASITNLVAIAVDRYIAIIYPLKYPSTMTRKRALVIIGFLWVYNLCLFVFPFVVNNYEAGTNECDLFNVLPRLYYMSCTFGAVFLCLALALVMYIRIFVVTQRHRKRLKIYNESRKSTVNRKLKTEVKSAKTMAVTLFLFFIFWIPFMAVGPLTYLNLEKNLIYSIKSIAIFIANCNSGINPIIYCWMRKDFNAAFKAIIRCSNRRKRNDIQTDPLSSFPKNKEIRKRNSNNESIWKENESETSSRTPCNMSSEDSCNETYNGGEIFFVSGTEVPAATEWSEVLNIHVAR